ncbi:hypothetical protein EST38_g3304 [Candolleomyces aberdarensis]|uniref:Integrase zinc-binding domain-containing protein n=1 Tax=Candolleomyces aberdarensis TaxID=2316362 RepID=A0A4Q2DR34_9AGAR|nr:hypothetical protein EST38_g3304 [Candolleomyces aberdarensis]
MSPERAARAYSLSSSAKPYFRDVFPGLSPDLSSMSSPSFSLLPVAVDHGASTAQSSPVLTSGGQIPDALIQTVERPGFPTYAQYKQIETGYIQSLTPRRQGKALISQAMFDRIWDVLHHPETQLETAQFRFWARKMFTIEQNYRITLGVAEGQEWPTQEVLLHDNLLVAIQEQLYDLLCYCHGSTGHGGRDKTCALIRKHYTWVPKDLVSNFIKACPTCIMKKCGGNVDVNSQIPQLMAEAEKLSSGAAHARLISVSAGGAQRARIIAQQDQNNDMSNIPRPRAAAPVETHVPDLQASSNGNPLGFSDASSSFGRMSASIASMSTFQVATHQMVSTSLPWTISGSHQGLTLAPLMSPIQASAEQLPPSDDIVAHHGGIHLHQGSPHLPAGYQFTQPMVREVSLYKGLPNGWQYRHDDFQSAHAEFMETKRQWDNSHLPDTMTDDLQGFRGDMSHYNAPRIPDVAGLWSPEHFRTLVKEEEVDDDSLLLSPGSLSYPRLQYPVPPPMMRSLDLSDSHLPPGLRSIQHSPQTVGSPQFTDNGGYIHQIDPVLLALSADSSVISVNSGSGSERFGPLFNNHNEGVDGELHPIDQSGDCLGGLTTSLPPSSYPVLSTSSTATSLSKRVVVPPPLQLDMLAANDKLLGNLMHQDDQDNHHHGDRTSGAALDSQTVAPNTPDRISSDAGWKTANTSPASTGSMESTRQLLSPFSERSDSSTPATTPVDEEGRGSLKVDRNLAALGGGVVVKKEKDEELAVEELVANLDESGDEGSRLLVAEGEVAC